jgi:hypothetical protein
VELDDRPGPARDYVVQAQKDWLEVLASSARAAVQEGQFHAELDPEQFAYEVHGAMLSFHHTARLLRDPQAEVRVRRAFDSLLARAQRPSPTAR